MWKCYIKLINPDGTKIVDAVKILPDGTYTKPKIDSTLFPDTWSDDFILDSIRAIGETPAIGGPRSHDGAMLHMDIVDGVEIIVIKIHTDVISA